MSYGDKLNAESIKDHLMRQDTQKAVQDAAQNAASNAGNVVPQVIAGITAGLAALATIFGA